MLHENIRNLRKSKGISQEELAIKLNVVRQTVSKWENGLSVPDAELLIRIAEELDTSVQVLLGEDVPVLEEEDLKTISAKLEILNGQFAKRREKTRKIWRTVFGIICIIAVLVLFEECVAAVRYYTLPATMFESVSGVGGVSGGDILVKSVNIRILPFIVGIALGVLGVVGLVKTREM